MGLEANGQSHTGLKMGWQQMVLVFIGGGLGSVARYFLSHRFNNIENAMPYGTLLANVLGSLFIGLIFGFTARSG